MKHIFSLGGHFYILYTDTTRRPRQPVSYQWCALPYFINFRFVLLCRYFSYSIAKFYHFSFELERKRRKTENETRQFSSKWTNLFGFNILGQTGARPGCSIYHQIAAIMKVFNVNRHYETAHSHLPIRLHKVTHFVNQKLKIYPFLSTCDHWTTKTCSGFVAHFTNNR